MVKGRFGSMTGLQLALVFRLRHLIRASGSGDNLTLRRFTWLCPDARLRGSKGSPCVLVNRPTYRLRDGRDDVDCEAVCVGQVCSTTSTPCS
jgi:hypothetical protein